MKTRDKFTALAIIALLLVPILAYSVQGANVIQDLFESLFGKGANILDIADLYNKYYQTIDFIMLLFIFISATQFAIGKRFEGAGNSGKVLTAVLGVALAIGSEWWMASNGMKLGDLGKIGILLILALVGAAIFFLTLRFAGESNKMGAAAAAYLLSYFLIQSVAPFAFDYLKENVSLIFVIIQLFFLVSLIYVVVSLVRLAGGWKGLMTGNNLQGLFSGGGLKTGTKVPKGPDISKLVNKEKAEKEESIEELRLERNITKASIKDKRDVKGMISALSKVIGELEKRGTISTKTANEFNAKVATDSSHLKAGMVALRSFMQKLQIAEENELKQAGEVLDNIKKANDAAATSPQDQHLLSIAKKDAEDEMDAVKSEFLFTRNNMWKKAEQIENDIKIYTAHIQSGVQAYSEYAKTRAPGDMQNAITQFGGAKKFLAEMEKLFDEFRQTSRTKRVLDRNKIRKTNRLTAEIINANKKTAKTK